MSRSVTIRFPEDGEAVVGPDFTADGVVCARMDPVDLTLSGGGGTVTISSADGRWAHDFAGIADGAYTLTAENTAGTGIIHSVDFTVTSTSAFRFVSTRTSRARPAAKKKSTKKPARTAAKRRRTA